MKWCNICFAFVFCFTIEPIVSVPVIFFKRANRQVNDGSNNNYYQPNDYYNYYNYGTQQQQQPIYQEQQPYDTNGSSQFTSSQGYPRVASDKIN